MTLKSFQDLKKVRQRKMYKPYLAFREKRSQMTSKIPAPKIPEKLQQEKIERRGLACGCQNSSVKEVLETGRASPIIYIQDQCDRRSFPRAVQVF